MWYPGKCPEEAAAASKGWIPLAPAAAGCPEKRAAAAAAPGWGPCPNMAGLWGGGWDNPRGIPGGVCWDAVTKGWGVCAWWATEVAWRAAATWELLAAETAAARSNPLDETGFWKIKLILKLTLSIILSLQNKFLKHFYMWNASKLGFPVINEYIIFQLSYR